MKTFILPRHIPAGFSVLKETPLAVVYGDAEKLRAIAYKGKSNKPVWFYRFLKEADMTKRINELFDSLENWEIMKQERKAERKHDLDNINVGDLLYCSWGWEQTNIDFYQVTEKKGKTITIRRISGRHHGEAPSGSMSDYVSPIRDAFIKDSESILKRSLSMKFGHLSLTGEAQRHFCSWYA